jgi:hypothetical protein
VFLVLYAIRIFVLLNNLVMILVSFPTYMKLAYIPVLFDPATTLPFHVLED